MKLSRLLPALLFVLAAGRPTLAQQARPSDSVAVGLVRTLAAATSITVECGGESRVWLDDKRVQADGASGKWRIAAASSGVVLTSPDGDRVGAGSRCRVASSDHTPLLVSRTPGARPSSYRGDIEVTLAAEGQRLLVVNRLPLEEYLRGVVPSEMPPSAPAAALQAQAVCARTYALKLRQSGKYLPRGYDLNDTTMCQAYGGVDAEKPSTDQAVRDTAGQVLLRNGTLTWADYCDDCGGWTAPGDTPDDFPPAVSDQADDGADWCAAGTHHAWSLTLTADELAKRLGATAKRIGTMTSVEILERDETRRVLTASIVGEDGEATIKGTALRAAIGYEQLRSTLFGVVRNDDGSFTFSGRGNGHGRGLCQWGAMGLAKPPSSMTCSQILDHYFPGATLGPAPENTAAALPSRSRRAVRRR